MHWVSRVELTMCRIFNLCPPRKGISLLRVRAKRNIDLHDLIERDAVLASILELRRPRRGVRRHLARLLERASVLEVGRDARAAEGVVADFGGDAGRLGPTAHHSPSVGSVQ